MPHTYPFGNYTAKIIAERGSAPSAENRVTITATNGNPTVCVSNCGGGPPPGSYGVFPGDYCSGVTATAIWQYSDPNSDPQSAYQLQIDNQGSFDNPTLDTGKITSSGNSYSIGAGILQFNTTYKARVRVWDSNNAVSSWDVSDSWKTPKHAYPQVNFTWSPTTPNANQSVQFTDASAYFSSPAKGKSWSWLFGDGGSSDKEKPKHTYTNAGNYNASLSATDQDSYTCSNSHTVNVVKPVPIWKEIAPKE